MNKWKNLYKKKKKAGRTSLEARVDIISLLALLFPRKGSMGRAGGLQDLKKDETVFNPAETPDSGAQVGALLTAASLAQSSPSGRPTNRAEGREENSFLLSLALPLLP